MKKKILALVLIVALVASLAIALTACEPETGEHEFSPIAKEDIKFGLICLHDETSTYDKNFIDAATQAANEMGVQLVIKRNVPEKGNECYEAAADLVDEGCNIIFANSFGHEGNMIEVAKEFPNVRFAHATGTKAHTENVANYHNAFASIYEGRYLAGIVAGMPSQFQTVYNALLGNGITTAGVLTFIAYIVMFIAIIILVVLMQLAERRIPMQYTTSQLVNRSKGDFNHLPLKINSASVIPVIFASTLIQVPQIITSWVNQDAYAWLSNFFNLTTSPAALVIYAILIILFTFFYTNLTVDPNKIAEDLAKQNSYIPGVRPGSETKEYLSNVLNRITVLGAILLTFIAVLPYAIAMLTG